MDELVWAKMRYCPYWPAKIVATPPQLGPTPRNKICVLFLGTKQFGFVEVEKIENYAEHRAKFVNKGKGVDFRTAVQNMDEYMSDNVKFRCHVYAKPINNKIKIKTEHDIEKHLGIKVENHQVPNRHANNLAENLSHNSWAQEKKTLIDSMIALKSENQNITRNLIEKDAKLSSLNASNKVLENRLTEQQLDFSKKIDDLKSQLLNAVKKDAASHKCIIDLKREHALLISQNKQLQTGLAQVENETANKSESDESNIFEVESLLDDKLITERHYLVHWKGYDSSQDSWERESNLSCTALLKKYKQLKKKH